MANHVGFGKYSDLLRTRDVRRVVALGLVIRIPLWAANIALVLHVVGHLNRSYVDAGLVSGVASLALAVSGPWRGRRLDRRGLRSTVGPALVVGALCWSVAPWVSFWPLTVLVLIAGLFVVPSFSIVRQVMIAAVPLSQRTAALSLDAVAVELSFMVGPVVGVLIATAIPTPIALIVCQFASLGGSLYLWWINPPLQAPGAVESSVKVPLRTWITPSVVMILVLALASTIVLNAEDLGIVAALREAGHGSWIGWELALWGGGSAVGGLLYGAAHRHPPASWMLLGLGISTALVALAPNLAVFTVLLTISGLFCAPTITATVDSLSRAVPDSVRGEAIGWHGSALTVGGAIAAPIIGAMLDAHGWGSGFWLGGLVGAVIAVCALLILRENRNRKAALAEASALDVEGGEDLAGGLAPIERVEVQPGSAGG